MKSWGFPGGKPSVPGGKQGFSFKPAAHSLHSFAPVGDLGGGDSPVDRLLAAFAHQAARPHQAEWEAGARDQKDRVAMQQLMEAASYGQVGDDFWPSKTTLERVQTAACYGYWAPPESCPQEAGSLNHFLKDLMTTLHAEIWQWRSTPATALNQIAICLDIACSPGVPQPEAEAQAIAYLRSVRERVFKFSRRAQFQETDSANFTSVQNAFLTTDLAMLHASKSGGQGTAKAAGAQEAAAPTTPGDVCLWHAMSGCRNRSCNKRHGPCPFCGGEACENKPGYLAWHLADSKTPRKIVIAKQQAPSSQNAGGPKRTATGSGQWVVGSAKRQRQDGSSWSSGGY